LINELAGGMQTANRFDISSACVELFQTVELFIT
jgi:hypothetical protein